MGRRPNRGRLLPGHIIAHCPGELYSQHRQINEVRSTYERMLFDCNARTTDAARHILGVGHAAVNQAIKQAKRMEASERPAAICAAPARGHWRVAR